MTREYFSQMIAELETISDLPAYYAETDGFRGSVDRRNAYTAFTRPFREIVKYTGLSQAKFARLYNIPRRTVENWCSGSRECPLYTSLLLQEAIGLISFSN